MKLAIIPVCLAFLLALLACSPAKDVPKESENSSSDIYRSFDGRSFIPCFIRDGAAGCGERLFHRPVSATLDTGMLSDESYWYDCGDPNFACVGNSAYLMAVPRKEGLRAGQVFKVRGSELVVRRCFPNVGIVEDECGTALISSRCVDSCGCHKDYLPTFGVFFYYSERVGVSAFMMVARMEDLTTALPERSWGLMADAGFLKADFNLPPMIKRDPCQSL